MVLDRFIEIKYITYAKQDQPEPSANIEFELVKQKHTSRFILSAIVFTRHLNKFEK